MDRQRTARRADPNAALRLRLSGGAATGDDHHDRVSQAIVVLVCHWTVVADGGEAIRVGVMALDLRIPARCTVLGAHDPEHETTSSVRKALSVVGASVTGAVLENVGFTVYRQDDRALV